MFFFRKFTTYAHYYFVLGVLITVLGSCGNDAQRKGDLLNSRLPTAFGSIGSLNVIADSSIWKGLVGDSIRSYFGRYYPILPQREASFTLRFFTPNDLSARPVRRELSNFLILADYTDKASPTTELTRRDLSGAVRDSTRLIKASNKWARDQMLLYLSAEGSDALLNQLRKYKEVIESEVLEHEKILLEKELYRAELHPVLQNRIRDSFGIDIRIPFYYQTAISKEDFLWIRGESEYVSRNIVFHVLPYQNREQFSPDIMKSLRDSLGRNITSTINGSYMLVNDIDLPLDFETKEINGNYAAVLDGIWEMEKDFLGGPFTSYLILSPDKKYLVFIDVFIHAPAKPKRDLMKELKYIVSTLEFADKKKGGQ